MVMMKGLSTFLLYLSKSGRKVCRYAGMYVQDLLGLLMFVSKNKWEFRTQEILICLAVVNTNTSARLFATSQQPTYLPI